MQNVSDLRRRGNKKKGNGVHPERYLAKGDRWNWFVTRTDSSWPAWGRWASPASRVFRHHLSCKDQSEPVGWISFQCYTPEQGKGSCRHRNRGWLGRFLCWRSSAGIFWILPQGSYIRGSWRQYQSSAQPSKQQQADGSSQHGLPCRSRSGIVRWTVEGESWHTRPVDQTDKWQKKVDFTREPRAICSPSSLLWHGMEQLFYAVKICSAITLPGSSRRLAFLKYGMGASLIRTGCSTKKAINSE